MKKLLFLASCLFLLNTALKAQENNALPNQSTKGTFYITWGYNKDYFSKSDLHFRNSGSDQYNFTLYDVKAKDRPGFKDIFNANISIPQYVYRLGYFFGGEKNLGIEINFDHTKYVMRDDQTL